MKSGAFGVETAVPIWTPDWKFDVNRIVPVPFAAKLKLLLLTLVVISGLFPPARVSTPAEEIELLALKNWMFPLVPLVVDTSVNVPDTPVPPLIVEFPPKVTLVVDPNVSPAAVVMLARPESLSVVAPESVRVEPEVMVLPDSDKFPPPKSSVPTLEIFLVAAETFPPSVKALIVSVLVDPITGAVPVKLIALLARAMFPVVAPPMVKVFKFND
jgi:hypothetical protein